MTMWQWKKEEAWGTGLLMLIALGGYVQVLMPGLSSSDTRFEFTTSALSSPVSKVMVGCLVLAALIPVVLRLRSLMRASFAFLPLVPYVTIAVASISWSENAELSLRRVISLLVTSLFGLYFAVRFPQRTQVRMLLTASSILAVATILLVWIAPQYSTDHNTHVGAWQGVFGGKNACAMVMVIGLAAALIYQPTSLVTRMWKYVSLSLFAVIILNADSGGAYVLMFLMLILVQPLRYLARCETRTRALFCWLLAVLFALAGFIAMPFIPQILKVLNRDPTLTGRTALWAQVWQSIIQRPMLGFGYGAFWDGLSGPSARIVLSLHWNAPHAHNGFLDIWLCLGWLGLAAFCLVLVQCVWRIWQVIRSHEMHLNLWLISSLVLIVLYNIDESVLISTPSLMWTLFVSSVCGLELHARQSSEQRHNLRSFAKARSFKPQTRPSFTASRS
jgi:exopolysaccharide production protein ExoQ